MPPRRLSLKAGAEHQGKRLDQVLAEWLPTALSRPVSKAQARKLIVAGAVYLNGHRVRIASKDVRLGARIEAHVDLSKLDASNATRQDRKFEMSAADILYEDDDLIAVNKPPGLPTQPTVDEARDNLFALVKKFLAARQAMNQATSGAPPYVGLHHRLDRDTSGVILFTKSARANPGVARLFSEHGVTKVYQALTVRPTRAPARDADGRWAVRNFLAKGASAGGKSPGGGGRSAKFQSVRSGGDAAQTDFRLLGEFSRGLWVEARPKTGRTHQIRVHLSEDGLPILGDRQYGQRVSGDDAVSPGGDLAPRLMLHAASLTFIHPITNVEVLIQSPLPEDFQKCLQKLRSSQAGGVVTPRKADSETG